SQCSAAFECRRCRVRADVRRRRGDALLRSRRRSDLRAHLAPRGRAAPMRRALFVASFCALALPGQAFAHATLEQTSPRFEQRLQTSPRTVQLRFDQYIELLPRSVQLFSTRGPLAVSQIRVNGRTLEATLPQLRRGGYTIRWHAMSGDGHVVSGVF